MTTRRLRHRRDHGGVTLLLIMVLIILSALMGALAVHGSTNDLRMSGSQRANRTGFYCSESGLNAARTIFATQISQWNTIFAGGNPAFTYPITGDLDGDGKPDYSVTIADNYDEFPVSNPKIDNDLTAVMTSVCTSSTLGGSNAQRTLKQIVAYNGNGGTDYRYQAGHSSTHSGNAN